MQAYARSWHTISVPAATVSLLSIAVMVVCLKYARKVPGAILVTFGATTLVSLLHLPL
jgi:MFS superfamily sulfate permease-like transporter